MATQTTKSRTLATSSYRQGSCLLGQQKNEDETKSFLFTHGLEVYAKNEERGRVTRRYLSRFTKIMEKSTQPPDPVLRKIS